MWIARKIRELFRFLTHSAEKRPVKSVDEQIALIRRGVDQIVPEAELRTKLERSVKTGVPLRVKYGIDPTGIDVHLGHTVPLRQLRLFQELRPQTVLIIRKYTAVRGSTRRTAS